MIDAGHFLERARAGGFDFYTGVPCSFLTPLINRVIGASQVDYVGATSEGEAVAIAAGAWLAGRGTVVICQNSGLGNAVNPVTSLCHPFRIPTLMAVTWRGGPGVADEPQHELMGAITRELLDVVSVRNELFPDQPGAVDEALDRAREHMAEHELPYALVMQKGTVREEPLRAEPLAPPAPGRIEDLRDGSGPPTRAEALGVVVEWEPPDAAVIATTGKCGRELFTLDDREQHLYQVGSMGCAAGMGLGLALNTTRPVVVLDGDGAALMKLGTLATVGAYAPRNLVHVVLDNRAHDSTGGQPTVSASVDFAAVAHACGYATATRCDSLDGLARALGGSAGDAGPHLVHLRLRPGSMAGLGRPTVTPREVARRFRRFVTGTS